MLLVSMHHRWLYLIMAAVGTILFYFGNEAPHIWLNEHLSKIYFFLWMLGGVMFIVGLGNASHACEVELKNRHIEEI